MILATNIAETSITVPGVRFVVDSGFVKTRTYSAAKGADSLRVVPVSQAQASQRTGRAGEWVHQRVICLVSWLLIST